MADGMRGFGCRRMRLRRTSAPYKLLGVYGHPVETTIEFVLPNRRNGVKSGVVNCKGGGGGFQVFDDGDSGDGVDLQD